jgi:hypothetical protein
MSNLTLKSVAAVWQQVLDNLSDLRSSTSGLDSLLKADNISKLLKGLALQPEQPAGTWTRLVQEVQVGLLYVGIPTCTYTADSRLGQHGLFVSWFVYGGP